MTRTLYLHAQNRPAVLERALRVTRHRGFDIKALTLQQDDTRKTIRLTVTVSGERPIDLLINQLEKLIDVLSVRVSVGEIAGLKVASGM